jgi:hypothetical protein
MYIGSQRSAVFHERSGVSTSSFFKRMQLTCTATASIVATLTFVAAIKRHRRQRPCSTLYWVCSHVPCLIFIVSQGLSNLYHMIANGSNNGQYSVRLATLYKCTMTTLSMQVHTWKTKEEACRSSLCMFVVAAVAMYTFTKRMPCNWAVDMKSSPKYVVRDLPLYAQTHHLLHSKNRPC